MIFNASLDGQKELLELLDKKTLNKVLNATANTEGRRFNTQVAKDIRGEYNIKSSDIKSKLKIKRAEGDDNFFEITISSPRLSLGKFITNRDSYIKTVTQTSRKGKRFKVRKHYVRVKVKKSGGTKLVQGGFMMNGRTLMRRRHKHSDRKDIKKLTTVSITGMFTEEIVDKGFKKVEENYPKTLERKLNFYISK